MHEPKDMDCAFAILSADGNPKHLDLTASSIRRKFERSPIMCVTIQDCREDAMSEMSSICRVVKARNTYSSMITSALSNPQAEWNFILISGSSMRSRMYRKYGCFVSSKRDILYPVVDRKMNFVDGTINGIMFHRDTFSEVGGMLEFQSIEESKMDWGYKAACLGYTFKGIVGAGLA